MPSIAKLHGADLLSSMLREGEARPQITIAGRTGPSGPSVAITVWPHSGRSPGEYRETAVVPFGDGPIREAAIGRVRGLIARWYGIEDAERAYEREQRECDQDQETDQWVEDDMPVPAWRIHCPAALVRLCDAAELDEAGRVALADMALRLTHGGATVTVEDCERDGCGPSTAPKQSRTGMRMVRRITLTAPGARYSQGIGSCRLELDVELPRTILGAAVGRPLSHLVAMAGLDDPGMIVLKATRGVRGGTRLDVARTFAMLGPMPDQTD